MLRNPVFRRPCRQKSITIEAREKIDLSLVHCEYVNISFYKPCIGIKNASGHIVIKQSSVYASTINDIIADTRATVTLKNCEILETVELELDNFLGNPNEQSCTNDGQFLPRSETLRYSSRIHIENTVIAGRQTNHYFNCIVISELSRTFTQQEFPYLKKIQVSEFYSFKLLEDFIQRHRNFEIIVSLELLDMSSIWKVNFPNIVVINYDHPVDATDLVIRELHTYQPVSGLIKMRHFSGPRSTSWSKLAVKTAAVDRVYLHDEISGHVQFTKEVDENIAVGCPAVYENFQFLGKNCWKARTKCYLGDYDPNAYCCIVSSQPSEFDFSKIENEFVNCPRVFWKNLTHPGIIAVFDDMF